MKCLFVRAPFAGWIVDGVKEIEYRTQGTNIRGKIGIIQSKSGTVIGSVEITGCKWNEKLEHFEWKLANGVRFAKPQPFQQKNGAVVWINVEVPQGLALAPRLTPEHLASEKAKYAEKIDSWLHPEKTTKRFFIVFKDGSRQEFASEEELDDFAEANRKTVDYAEILD